ncbi:DUF3048 domain-containing protein [Eubacterium sp. am_0171]|uniref:Putative lipoprotein yerB n=1 Tax=Faecalicatena contorta TaxID=39482 RepID=A0A174M767_9FIRM|nr:MULTISPECIES: DUF3048 domain-containing protein [Clostridia]MSC84095.1 DUF3048 domain-containing protein [Eubacterium sp. BIOML-A1]MSD06522.1 DUF3048 domain-containing protein [Eubacterium sp. BIOML-A2]RYT19605.1 DUF3048 domain-containing protein [Eubacterium sp. am_0171]CUP30986.1 Putative lipoprotein yerB precursor [[Eubacterium] contortum] [Faecalicatena contorta]
MKRLKKVSIILLVFLMIFGMAGCKKKEAPKRAEKTEEKEVKEKKEEPKQEEVPANQNLLTGLADLTDGAIGKRPVAVMVNNVEAALPQLGISKADIIYEIPVEGDVTRLMALYADYTAVPKICAVRSCRYYFPAYSQGYDAFYVNWGIDDSIADYLEALNLDQYDGMNNAGGLFGRDQDRLNAGYSLEHTGFFDGTRFAEVVQAEGRRTDLNEDKKGTAFQFNGMDEQLKPEGQDCKNVSINFGAATATLTYDEGSKTYLKQINGKPQMDGSDNTQLAFTNVFVLETDISVRDDIGHKEINWYGGSDYVGYYVSNGGMQKIHWSKEANNENSYLRFYDGSGKEIKVNRGKSYIAVNYKGQSEFQ